MSKFVDRLKGIVRVEIQGVFYESLLNSCALEGVALWELEFKDKYCFTANVYENQMDEFETIAIKSGCEIKTVKHEGGSRNKKFIVRRKYLLAFLLLALLLLFVSSLFIWQIEIHGAEKISHGLILRALADCGVEVGKFRFSFSPDLVRSRMMSLVPEIGWMTVNVSGSRAIVLIEERIEKPEIYKESEASYIIAGNTGIIRELSVLNGRSFVSVGQAVLAGETLVSGVMESLSQEPRTVRARAKIMADTWYEITALRPTVTEEKNEEKWSYSRFSLILGKKRINFYFSGRNDIDECVKIVHEYNLGADGIFALPVSIVREEIIFHQRSTGKCKFDEDAGQRLLEELGEAIDGEIVSSSFSNTENAGVVYACLRAVCYENIARNIDMNSAELP